MVVVAVWFLLLIAAPPLATVSELDSVVILFLNVVLDIAVVDSASSISTAPSALVLESKIELFRVNSPKGHEFVLKPVQCPHHTQIFSSKLRSYKELPIRYMESDKQYR